MIPTSFASLEELQTFIKKYEEENAVELLQRHPRYLGSMKQPFPTIVDKCNVSLVYYSLYIACSKAGRKYASEEGCQMHIDLKMSEDGQKLQVSSFDETHNHGKGDDEPNTKQKTEVQSQAQQLTNKVNSSDDAHNHVNCDDKPNTKQSKVIQSDPEVDSQAQQLCKNVSSFDETSHISKEEETHNHRNCDNKPNTKRRKVIQSVTEVDSYEQQLSNNVTSFDDTHKHRKCDEKPKTKRRKVIQSDTEVDSYEHSFDETHKHRNCDDKPKTKRRKVIQSDTEVDSYEQQLNNNVNSFDETHNHRNCDDKPKRRKVIQSDTEVGSQAQQISNNVNSFEETHNHRNCDDKPSTKRRKVIQSDTEVDSQAQQLSNNVNELATSNDKVLQDHNNLLNSRSRLCFENEQDNCEEYSEPLENSNEECSQDVEYFVHNVMNEDKTLAGIYFQTQWMKNCFTAYPEVFLLVGPTSLKNSDMSIYSLMTVNGNNELDPVAIFAVTNMDSEIFTKMANFFKAENPQWSSVKYIFSDKNIDESIIIKNEFPDAYHQMCMFNPLKHFKNYVKNTRIGFKTKTLCYELFKKICVSNTPLEYENLHKQLMRHCKRLSDYYTKEWHLNKSDWVHCYKTEKFPYGIKLTNHVELYIQIIEKICDGCKDPDTFFDIFCILLNKIKSSREKSTNLMMIGQNLESSKLLYAYMELLTPHAFQMMHGELEIHTLHCVTRKITHYTILELHNSEAVTLDEAPKFKEYKIEIGTYKCWCDFNMINHLPCSHILAVRNYENAEKCATVLTHPRHLKSNYIEAYSTSLQFKQGTPLSSQQKYNIALHKCTMLAQILSKCKEKDFHKWSKEVDKLIDCCNKEGENETTVQNLQGEENLGIQESEAYIEENKEKSYEEDIKMEIKCEY